MRVTVFLVFLVTAAICHAQIAPFPSNGIKMDKVNTQLVEVPAQTSPTLANVVVDSSSTGGDLIDVNVGDPSVVISLIAPGGAEISAGNASRYGFTVSSYTPDQTSDTLDPMISAGTHTVI